MLYYDDNASEPYASKKVYKWKNLQCEISKKVWFALQFSLSLLLAFLFALITLLAIGQG